MRLDHIDEALVRRVQAMIFMGRRYPKSLGYYQDAALALAELKADRPREMWNRILREHVGITPSRAYELLSLLKGRSLEEVRKANSARARKHRKDKWLPTKPPRSRGSKREVLSVTADPGGSDGTSTPVRLPSDRQ